MRTTITAVAFAFIVGVGSITNPAMAQVVTASGHGDISKATAGDSCAKRNVGGVEVAVDLVNTPTTAALARLQTIDARTAEGAAMQINTYMNISNGLAPCQPNFLPRVDFVN